MNDAPKGKTKAIQEQVNRRLENGKKVRTLVVWLNAGKPAGNYEQ